MRVHYLLLLAFLPFIFSCNNTSNKHKSRGAIILGDSSTIITETNPTYLEDYVSDLRPSTDTISLIDTSTVSQIKTDTVATVQKTPAASGKGLSVEFSEVTIVIPNIEARSFKNQNTKTLNGVSYQLTDGALQGNQLTITGGKVNRVSQRYISTFVVTKGSKVMELDKMDETTSWKVIKGSGGIYKISGLETSQLDYKKVSASAVRTAVSRTAKANRMSRSEIREWENSVKNIKTATQAPIKLILQSVMWKIEGKDAKGKSFTKELRIDMPI